MKKLLIALLIMVASLCSLFADSVSYDFAIKGIVKVVSDYAGKQNPVAFVNLECDYQEFGDYFTEDLMKELLAQNCLVVDRKNIDLIIEELRFQASGLVSEKNAVSIGNMAGAKYIITGSVKNMTGYLKVSLDLTDVETGLIKKRIICDIKYNPFIENLISGKDGIGNSKLGVFAKLGVAFGINEAHNDMIGEDYVKLSYKSLISFNPSFGGLFKVADRTELRFELAYLSNNGIKILDYNDDLTVAYHSIDLPLSLRFSFIRRPLDVSVFAGAYLSIPCGNVDISYEVSQYGKQSGAVKIKNIIPGAFAGICVGVPCGTGTVVLDTKYFRDFYESKVEINNETKNMMLRSGIAVSAGYSISL